MKTLFLILPLLLQSIVGNAQNEFVKKINEGINEIQIDQTRDKLESVITPIETKDLWQELYMEGMITSTATVDLSKTKDYFGLKVSRIEIQFESHYDETSGTEKGEDIFQFTIFLEYPTEEKYSAFIKKIEDELGPIRTYSIGEDDKQSLNWFTHITLLTISGKDVFIEKDGKKYITAHYVQAYGG